MDDAQITTCAVVYKAAFTLCNRLLQPVVTNGCTTTLYNRCVPRPRHAIMTSLTLLPSAVIAPFLFVFSGSTMDEDDDDDLFIAATAAAAVDIIIKRRRRRRQRRRLQW